MLDDFHARIEAKYGLGSGSNAVEWEHLSSFLGINIIYDVKNRHLTMDVAAKIDALFEEHKILRMLPNKATPLPDSTSAKSRPLLSPAIAAHIHEHCASLVGALIYMSVSCRPDIAYGVGRLSRHKHGPTEEAAMDCAHLLGYLGDTSVLCSNLSDAAKPYTDITSFNSNGFTLGFYSGWFNSSGETYASWTFRKAPKFFDVVTWTGDGISGKTISHNLGSTPGCVIIKRTDTTSNWTAWHRSLTAEKFLRLNLTDAEVNAVFFVAVDGQGNVNPTDSVITLGNSSQVNASGGTYVAYVFAHDAGGFGEDGEQNVISCGSFTTDGSGNATVDLGYEPQWVMNKTSVGTADNWLITDTMRGASHTSAGFLFANLSNAEGVAGYEYNTPTANGFNVRNHSSSTTYIYIAIRRPMKTPESGTEVFAIDTSGATAPTPPAFNSGFPVDMAFYKQTDGSSGFVSSRLTSNAWMALELTQAETANAGFTFDFQDGWRNNTQIAAYRYSWMFRRASGFMGWGQTCTH